MVTRILRLDAPPKPADAADALALAITHIWRGGAQARLEEAVARQTRAVPTPAPFPGGPRDRLRPRPGGRGDAHQRRARGRRCRPRADVHPRHPGHPPPKSAPASRPRCRPDGGARGVADPLRLPRRRREGLLRAACRPPRASGPSWPRRCSRCSPPTTCAAPSAAEDVKTLTRVPGIGQKGAQRIILELKDRLGAPVGVRGAAAPAASAEPWRDQVHQGLVGLGWSAKDADRAVDEVAPRGGRERRRRDPAARGPAHALEGLIAGALRPLRRVRGRRGEPSALADRGRGRRRRARRRGRAAPPHARRGRGPAAGARPARAGARGRPAARARPRPRAALRASGPGQDDAGDDHRPRDERRRCG